MISNLGHEEKKEKRKYLGMPSKKYIRKQQQQLVQIIDLFI